MGSISLSLSLPVNFIVENCGQRICQYNESVFMELNSFGTIHKFFLHFPVVSLFISRSFMLFLVNDSLLRVYLRCQQLIYEFQNYSAISVDSSRLNFQNFRFANVYIRRARIQYFPINYSSETETRWQWIRRPRCRYLHAFIKSLVGSSPFSLASPR